MTRDHLLTLYTIEIGDKLPLNDSCGSEEDFLCFRYQFTADSSKINTCKCLYKPSPTNISRPCCGSMPLKRWYHTIFSVAQKNVLHH